MGVDDIVLSPIPTRFMAPNNRWNRIYNNPHFDYLSEMLPKDIKELFKWCEVVYNSMPAVANAIRKLVHYPITDFSFDNVADEVREMTKQLLDTLDMKQILMNFNTDFYVYGNAFRTIYMPFKRFLVCSNCKREVAIENVKFRVRKKQIEFNCECGNNRPAKIHDIDTFDTSKIRIVCWDAKNIELIQNPITGHTRYFYKLPPDFKKKVLRAEPTVFYDTPEIFIKCALENKNVEFGKNFYHAKMPSLSGYQSGWGISPIMSTLRIYMYIAVLRRASQAIGMEHITPQRILFPQSAGNGDPTQFTSMERWRKEITKSIERWRLDPNYVMLAPYPTGVANIGSQGRALAPINEIKDARMEMCMALDIPPALLSGETTLQNSTVSLRILENQLTPHVKALEKFLAWIIEKINSYMDKNYATPTLVPFKLADDMMQKQMLMNMMQAQALSKRTMQEVMDIDPDVEREKIKDDALRDNQFQMETQREMQEQQNSLSNQIKSQVEEQQTGMPSQYNQQKMIAQAQQLAQQLAGIPYEQRRSQLAQLQNEDYVMWAIVSKQLEVALAQMKQQQGQQ